MSTPVLVTSRAIYPNSLWSCFCCGEKEPLISPSVYVNSKGEAVRFDPDKATDEEFAIRRSAINLEKRIYGLAESQNKDGKTILQKVKDLSGVHISPDKIINMEQIQRVNKSISEILYER